MVIGTERRGNFLYTALISGIALGILKNTLVTLCTGKYDEVK